MEGAIYPFYCLYLVKCGREILSNANKRIQKYVPEDMGYLCHVPVGEIIALVSQSEKKPGIISRTNLVLWDQELAELNKGKRSKFKN
ncbi:hypothetical protein CDAR_549591 [Caerostris darwini]|uniref:Uncharacterized protein n=1 Tax=Caerostris darwini TaxID=1538125 RepID=A0AAV4TXJ6_9ARAC|nr:hypothetical protein CDAR_549591 [Caerostris darwini]